MRQPDIEVYTQADYSAVEQWLSSLFDTVQIDAGKRRGSMIVHTGSVRAGDVDLPVLIVEGAIGKYLSMAFDSDATPWDDDYACATDLAAALGQSVRCAAGGWQEEQGGAQADDWWQIAPDGAAEKVRWPNS